MFRSPLINIYSRDLAKAQFFYASLGFKETFRTPPTGNPIHVELRLDGFTLDGFTLGIATIESAQQGHGLATGGEGRWIEVVLWTDDTDAAIERLAAAGAPVLSPTHDFLDGRLRAGWVADPDGNPIQIVQRKL